MVISESVSTLTQICRNGFLSIGIRAGTSVPRAGLRARPRQSTPEDILGQIRSAYASL